MKPQITSDKVTLSLMYLCSLFFLIVGISIAYFIHEPLWSGLICIGLSQWFFVLARIKANKAKRLRIDDFDTES